MRGSVSDAYDPEFGTAANAAEIQDAIECVYDRLNGVLGGAPPVCIIELVSKRLGETKQISATLTEYEWRILRFACERAGESV